MFGKEKKQQQEKKKLSENVAQDLTDKNRKKIENDLVIHTMPKKFLSGRGKSDQAKKTGIIIFGLAGIFLVIMIIILYVILFQTPKTKDENKSDNRIMQNQPEDIIKAELIKQKKLSEEKNNITQKNNAISKPNSVVSTSSKQVINEEVATSTEDKKISTSTSDVIPVQPILDSDNDGLNNLEEDLLGTNENLVDSDGDGYDDLSEIKNFYNPAGEGKLIDNLGIDEYINSSYNYSVFYPSEWQMNILGSDDSIVFKSPNNDIFQIYVQPNSRLENIKNWYERQIGQKVDNKNIVSAENWTGVYSSDGLIIYLTDKNYNFVYTLLYIPEFAGEETYNDIFQIMVDSFQVKGF